MIQIMTIPLLPNRIPLASLSELSAQFPRVYLDTLSPYIIDIITQTSTSAHINILTNSLTFIPSSRYATLPLSSLSVYIQFLAALLSALPIHAFDPLRSDSKAELTSWDADSDADEDDPTPGAAVPQLGLPILDAKTRKKLQTLPSPSHLHTLLKLTQQHRRLLPDVVVFLVSLNIMWPATKDKVLSTLILYGGGGLVREIFRDQVRATPLGRNENMAALMGTINLTLRCPANTYVSDPSFQPWWPPLILLTDLYTHTLRTMGDDEFFSNSSMLLTLHDLVPFSRSLFSVAFTLYWRDDQWKLQEAYVPGLNLRWVNVREKITKCLVAIHARE